MEKAARILQGIAYLGDVWAQHLVDVKSIAR
jgi:hypothetical protein